MPNYLSMQWLRQHEEWGLTKCSSLTPSPMNSLKRFITNHENGLYR